MDLSGTIVAIATGVGGAISVIRVGGSSAIEIVGSVFHAASGKPLASNKGYTLHYGTIIEQSGGGEEVIDDVVVSLFRAPRSYTGEDMVEISCHGSTYIQQRIVELLIRHGARSAQAGEFTIRAFLNGKLDLAQAESVADMIASTDRATHAMALQQIRGGYSSEFHSLRERLVELVSLLELELDFAEEDVSFADRTELSKIIEDIERRVDKLLESFRLGNTLKNGVPVAIVGEPNVGKSTLLNTLLNEDRAMVSDIAGTTRDVIEESLNINGIRFRFIDTAGIRETTDRLEQMGIERTMSSIERAAIIVLLVDAERGSAAIADSLRTMSLREDQKLCVVVNKIDKLSQAELDLVLNEVRTAVESISVELGVSEGCERSSDAGVAESKERNECKELNDSNECKELPSTVNAIGEDVENKLEMGSKVVESSVIPMCAKSGLGVPALLHFLSEGISAAPLYNGDTVVSNARHYEALHGSKIALANARQAMSTSLPTDLLTQEIHHTLHHLSLITGEITTNDILHSIFSKFCIGK